MLQATFCLHFKYSRVRTRNRTWVINYPHAQICIWTGNRPTLAPTYSSRGSQSMSSNTKLHESSFYFQMATGFIAAPFYCFKLCLNITFLSFLFWVSVLMPWGIRISDFCFGTYKRYFTIEVSACKFPRYNTACLTGFVWSKAAFVGFGVSAFQPMEICPLNGKRRPEYFQFLTPAKL